MDKNTVKAIRIKTGVLKRSLKDYTSYKDEVQQFEEKIQQLRLHGASELTIEKENELLQETASLIPTIGGRGEEIRKDCSCKTKIESALEELRDEIEDFLELEEFKSSEEGIAAKTIVSDAIQFLQNL